MLRRALSDVLLAWLVLSLVTTIPYLIALARTPSGTVFTGVITAQDDTFSYLAWIKQAAGGHILMRDLFTSEQQTARFFLPLWIALGWTANVTGLPVAIVFHAARILSSLLVLLAAWAVGRCVMKSRTRLRFLVWMVGFSAGWGWVVFAAGDLISILLGKSGVHGYKMGTMPVDINMPEATVFRSAFCQVHMNVGAALICFALVFAFRAIFKRNRTYALFAGLLASVLAVVHPYEIVVTTVVACAILAACFVFRPAGTTALPRMDLLWIAAAFFAGNLPGLGYLLYLRGVDTVLREWLSTMSTLSPNPFQYLLGFGFLVALAIAGGIQLWQGGKLAGQLLLVWIVVQSLLLYAPFSFQRRLVEGLQIPLCAAAASGVFWMLGRIHTRPRWRLRRRLLLSSVVVLCSLTSIGFIIGSAAGLGEPDPRRYLDASLVDSLKWLGDNAAPDSQVMSSYMTGNVVPTYSGLGVFLGHYDQTIHSGQKAEEVAAFYSGWMTDSEQRAFFERNHLTYCIYGPFEHALSANFAQPGFLQLVHGSQGVDIYRVNIAEPGVPAMKVNDGK